MSRSLGRFFLYLLYLVLLLFLAGSAWWLLQLLLSWTPLRGNGSTLPASSDLMRALVLWGVTWLIGLPLVIFLFRLLRRDQRTDPQAGRGGIRAFFLNLVEAVLTLAAVSVAASVIEQIGQSLMGDLTGSVSFVVLSLALVAWLEWERRQAQAGSPAALVFQRLHFSGVQLILLLMLTSAWLRALRPAIDALVFKSQGAISQGFPAVCGGLTVCANGPNLLSLAGVALWITCFWLGSGLLARGESLSRWYQVTHLAGLAWGLGYTFFGLERGIELLLLFLRGVSLPIYEITGPGASYDFASPLLVGLGVSAVSGLWLRRVGRQQTSLARSLALWAEALAAFLLAVAFCWGSGLLLADTFERVFGTSPDQRAWMDAFAFLIVGIAAFPLALHLSRRSLIAPQITAPLRSFILALLSGGIVTVVIGASVALYLLGTFLLGSPLDHWQANARAGLAALLVGALVVAIFLWLAFRERIFAGWQKSKEAPEPAAQPAPLPALAPELPLALVQVRRDEVEAVLDAMLEGHLTREEASARIQRLFLKQEEQPLRAS